MAIDYKKSISDPIAVDVGNVATQGRTASKSVQFAYFTSMTNAVQAAKDSLRKESYPFAVLNIPVNRNLFRLQVGDCFKFSYDKYSISNMVCRVLQITEENLESEKLIIHAMEDIYSISNIITEYDVPTGLTIQAPSYDLIAFTNQIVEEAPYVLSEDIRIMPLACRTSDLDLGFDIYMSIDSGASYSFVERASNLRPYGTLVANYSADTYTIDEETGFQIEFVDDAETIETTTWANLFSAAENFALLGEEIVSFKTITPVSGEIYTLEDVIRGRFGTSKIKHSAGEDFYFLDSYVTIIGHPEIAAGAVRKFKLVPFNVKLSGEISDATAIDLTVEGLAKSPYIPTNFLANGSSFAARYTDDIILTWTPRYRGRGAGIGIPGIVLAGTDREGLFEIEVWVSDILVRTTTAIDAATWTYTNAMNVTDNGTAADVITFKLSNYRTEDDITYVSDQVTVICKETYWILS